MDWSLLCIKPYYNNTIQKGNAMTHVSCVWYPPIYCMRRVMELSRRRALLVSPSYYVEGLDPVVLHTLRECNVMPKDFKNYRLSRAAKDRNVFVEKVLGSGAEIKILTDTVYRRTVMADLAWLLEPNVDVAALLFCGHGVNEGSSRHGTMVCSYKELLTAESIDEVVAAQRFRGTFIRVLNMCKAEAMGPDRQTSQHGRSQRDAAKAEQDALPRSPSFKVSHMDVMVLASGPFQETNGGWDGSQFIAAMGKLFDSELRVTYERLEELLQRHWPLGGARVIMQPGRLKGIFGWPASRTQVNAFATVHACLEKEKYVDHDTGIDEVWQYDS